MEIFILVVALAIAFYCTILSAALSSLSQDKLDNLKQAQDDVKLRDTKKYKRLNILLKMRYEESEESFFIIEAVFYLTAFIVLDIFLLNKGFFWYYLLIYDVLLFIIIALLRSIFWAIGSRFADIIAFKMTGMISFFHCLISPFYKLLTKIIEAISGKELEEASRDELNAMFETAHEEGSIEADEYRILKNIMHFSDVLVTDVMTPRTMLFSSHADLTVNDIINLPEIQMYSRFPIWDGHSIDDGIVGYVISKDVLYAALKGKSTKKLREFSREVYIIPENASLDKALEQFLQRRQHLTIVVDEYGGVEGILTMEDVLETILGVEIVDEVDKIVDLRDAAKHQRDKRIANFQSGRSE